MNYLYSGNRVILQPEANMPDIRTVLEPKTYSVGFDSEHGHFFLEVVEDMKVPEVIYGTIDNSAERIINTFKSRENQTGLYLSGEKGSGKTLLGKMLSTALRKQGMATLIVNTPFSGEAFNKFMASIDQECMVMFDEFEKNYDTEDQERILTLFDGTHNSKKLYVVTVNDTNRVNGLFMNRPGRFFYHLEYEGLDEDFIRDYLERNLQDDTEFERTFTYLSNFGKLNFDMIQAVVEEMNRYKENVIEASRLLNVSMGRAYIRMEALNLTLPKETMKQHKKDYGEFVVVPADTNFSPSSRAQTVMYYVFKPETPKSILKFPSEYSEYLLNTYGQHFTLRDIVSQEKGVIEVETDGGFKCTLKKAREQTVSYSDYF